MRTGIFLCLLAQDTAKTNQILLKATGPFEDMIVKALAKDDARVSTFLSSADDAAAKVRQVVPRDVGERFDALLLAIHRAFEGKKHLELAQKSLEAFKLLLEQIRDEALKVPLEVGWIDYGGYKLRILAAVDKPDWAEARKTVAETSAWWKAVQGKVTSKKVSSTVKTALAGLDESCKIEDRALLDFAAQVVLDLVDVLEELFKKG